MATAIVGTLTSLPIRRTPVAHPGLKLRARSLLVSVELQDEFRRRPELLSVLAVTSVFWCVGGVYQQGVNDLGILQLQIKEAATGILGACAAIGIGVGCAAAGRLSQGRFDARLVKTGLCGMIAMLTLLSLPGPMRGDTLLGVWGSGVVLVLLGASAGLFAVPLQVFLQAMAPPDQKGQIIGTMNLCNWIGILLSAVLHRATTLVLAWTEWPANRVFLVGVALLLPLAILYRPESRDLSPAAGDE